MFTYKHTFCLVILFVCTMIYPIPASATSGNSSQELIFLNWADYIDPDLIQKFEHQFKCKVRIVTFDGDDHRDQLLISTDGKNFDVVLVDGNSLHKYQRRGWLEKITNKEVPNIETIIPKWRSAYESAEDYAVPYFWGTVGIAFRTDLVKNPIESWMDLMKPSAELQGNFLMLPQSRELIDIALKTLGYSVNTSGDPQAYAQASALLMEQKQYVREYDILAVDEGSALISGEVLAAMTYSGDALALQELNENISYIVPHEGTVLWVDYLAVMAKSEKKKLAMDFMNFLNVAEHAAQHAQYMYYATPNRDAEKLLPKDFLSDPIIYPPHDILEKCEIESDLSAREYKKRNVIFARVTQGKI